MMGMNAHPSGGLERLHSFRVSAQRPRPYDRDRRTSSTERLKLGAKRGADRSEFPIVDLYPIAGLNL